MAGVSDYLYNLAQDPFLDNDVNWRQYISDHRNYIIASANQVYPSGQMINSCKYDIKRWLRQQNYNASLWWIVLKINDLDSDMDFTIEGVNSVIYIPTVAQINALYQNYLTTSTNRVTDPLGE